MAIIKQISSIVNDAFKDAIGTSEAVTELDTSTVVSMGTTIEKLDLYEMFYKSLVNRIVKTIYFVRPYRANERSIMRDEHEYGAFVQKVYYKMPDAVDDAAFSVTTDAESYKQASPYDVESVVAVEAAVYGGQGVWSIEIIRPLVQIKTAFTSDAAMMAFINGIYETVSNKMNKDMEDVVNMACNTAIASAYQGKKARNLLKEYNDAHAEATLTVAQALENLDFLKFATREIRQTIKFMEKMSTAFNVKGYETYTDRDNMVVEILSHFASAADTYLQADTYHNELTALPRYEEVPFWQASGKDFSFDVCSSIKVKNDGLIVSESNETGQVSASGIIAFIHDRENVAAYFGERRTWEIYNPRSEVFVHGEKARKGYAVDEHANAYVFYIAES